MGAIDAAVGFLISFFMNFGVQLKVMVNLRLL